MIDIRRMDPSEIGRLSEIDRTEHVTKNCRMENGCLVTTEADWRIGRWDAEKKIREWAPIVDGWRNMWGAFDGDTLVGISVYRPNLTGDTAQLALLHISRGYRRMGIGKRLAEKVLDSARSDGAKRIYVTSFPSRAATDFYLNLGFRPAEELNEELYRLEPDDIHLVMDL